MEDLANALLIVLSNSYILQLKAQSLHWNVVGVNFYQTHLQLERVYNTVYEDVDRIAESIRAVDAKVPASLAVFLNTSSVKEFDLIPDTSTAIRELVSDVKTAQADISKANLVATRLDNLGVVNMLGDISEKYNTLYYILSSSIKV